MLPAASLASSEPHCFCLNEGISLRLPSSKRLCPLVLGPKCPHCQALIMGGHSLCTRGKGKNTFLQKGKFLLQPGSD